MLQLIKVWMMNVSFLNMNVMNVDVFTSCFWHWPLLFHVRENCEEWGEPSIDSSSANICQPPLYSCPCLCVFVSMTRNRMRVAIQSGCVTKIDMHHFTCFNTILALSLSSPCRTQLLPSSDFLSYLPLNLSWNKVLVQFDKSF